MKNISNGMWKSKNGLLDQKIWRVEVSRIEALGRKETLMIAYRRSRAYSLSAITYQRSWAHCLSHIGGPGHIGESENQNLLR